ncbi:MAG TPA: UvrD-helicase domain-containing protein [Bryobacteraceae bacterium]|nr:UvrD-helicase domain-containing protein [Bryobacteraceae bacterium]
MTPSLETRLDDQAARDRIRTSLAESLLVEASAGTGKTTELIARIVSVLASGATTIDHIVAVTFTNKAAGELKLRLRQELDLARDRAATSSEGTFIENALEHLEEACIGTIHSFCAQMLRERPVEAVVDPAFEELSEPQAARIYERAFRAWFQEKLGQGAAAIRRALLRLAGRESWDHSPPIEQLQYAGWKLIEWRDHPTPWRHVAFDRNTQIDVLVEQVHLIAGAASRCCRPGDNLVQSLRPAQALVTWIQRAEATARARDYDTLESLLGKLLRDLKRNTRKGSGFFAENVPREQVLAARETLIANLEAFQQAADADLAASLRDDMWELVERYDALKRRAGRLDFVDLLLLARDLVRDNAEVRCYLQERFTHIFIDEFQDTDPLQAEILLLLASADPAQSDWMAATPKPGKLFVVGDPKQSIYKFRRADVVLYRDIREKLAARGVGIVQLTTSFRALRPIQECVNAAFHSEMQDDAAAGQAAYAPLHGDAAPIEGQPNVVVLPVPRPYGSARISKAAINECLPGAIVALVEWLVKESGWKVRDPENSVQHLPLSHRHICILFRRFTNLGADITRDYVRGLEAREIPHLLVGSKSFHGREEVETIRAALNAIEWPDDDLSVFAALKGSLFAIPDNLLLRFCHEIGRLHPFRPLPEDLSPDFAMIADALKLLAELHRGRNRRPIADTVNWLLEATRAHAGFALRPAGHQVLANVYRVADLARSFELAGGISFRGFVEELESQAEKAESAEAPVLEEGAEGVRLMTVHSAKGLEFPVVILADITANIAAGDPDRYVDARQRLCATRLLRCAPWELRDNEAQERLRERAEGVRVAYVAATRARDLLVVPAVGDEEFEGWVAPLNKAIYPAPELYRNSKRAAGCPKFGEASIIDRPFFCSDEPSVRPGLLSTREGTHAVVWWDPHALNLTAPANFGLRQEEILTAPDGAGESPSRQAFRLWETRRDDVTAKAQVKQFDIFTATEAAQAPDTGPVPGVGRAGLPAEGPEGFEIIVAVESVEKPADRPAGPRFGTLVHTILRDAPLNADRAALEALAEVHGRLLAATPEEVKHSSAAALAALRHPLIERARKAERVRREFPVLLKLDASKVLEGVIDLAFEAEGRWHIIDFKTDADLAANRARYERQLGWYCLAMSRLNQARVEAHLLSV